MKYVKEIKIVTITSILAFGIGYFTKPSKVKTEIKEVVKTETVKEEGKTRIVEKEKIVYKDGTIIEREKIIDESKIRSEIKTQLEKELKKEETNHLGLNVSLLAITSTKKLTQDVEYGIHINKRVVGNITLGAFANTQKQIGISAGMSF